MRRLRCDAKTMEANRLATSYGIVKQHQGWIEVGSVMGKGSRFTLFLPKPYEPSRLAKAVRECLDSAAA